MGYLLTIHSGELSAESALKASEAAVKPTTLEADALPVEVEVPGGELRFEETGRPGEVRVTLLQPAPPAAAAAHLRCGDLELSAGESVVVPLGRPLAGEGWWLQMRRQRRRAKVSSTSALLGKIAAVGVVLLMLAQLFVSQGLPIICRNGDFWRRQREVQEIFAYSDLVQRHLERLSCKDGVTAAFVDALRGEMSTRRAFLRKHSQKMRPSLRRAMLENLKNTENLLLKIEERGKDGLMPPLPELSIDGPVEKIIREYGE